ncbi:hypothetical protein GCM10007913_11870 [Devosia yakushimensis]|uniref:Uncharacterized protein n=1 Tax=Devosia yakushimensis TaxID=470028 RepID=A0ABQ5UAV1_9HYPH|nr:hypothetical protein [Devosia yakushimensis]GLQ09255.1 hypothetical protein GCM10007913_11870 [Devosia yakushimensis]
MALGTDQLVEKIETLDGARPRAKRKAAVRIEDIAALLAVEPQMQAKAAAGATPTKQEYDALLADTAKLQQRLLAVAEALRARLV